MMAERDSVHARHQTDSKGHPGAAGPGAVAYAPRAPGKQAAHSTMIDEMASFRVPTNSVSLVYSALAPENDSL
jgi:hypothetical protein